MAKFINIFAVSFILLYCFLQTVLAEISYLLAQDDTQIDIYNGSEPLIVEGARNFNISCNGLQMKPQSFRQIVYWTRNNLSIPELATKWQVINENGKKYGTFNTTLVGSMAEKKHEGEYRCTRNGPPIHVTVHAVKKIKLSYHGSQSVDEHGHWYILCNHTVTKIIRWTRNNISLEGDDEVIIKRITSTTSMVMSWYAKPHHNGNYKCTDEKKDLGFDLNVKTVFIKVPKYTGPFKTVTEGEKWIILCEAEPGTNFHWTRDDQEIPEFATGEIIVSYRAIAAGTTEIYSSVTYREHSGKYKCIPGDDNGYQLRVVAAKKDIQVIKKNQKNLQFPCSVNQNLTIDNWVKNGLPFQNISNAHHQPLTTFDPKSGDIIIHKVHRNVYGYYICRRGGDYFHQWVVVPRPKIAILNRRVKTDYSVMDLACRGNLWPEVTIHWECNQRNYMILPDKKNGIRNGILRIYNLKYGERVNVTCRAWYESSNKDKAKKTISIENL